MNVGRGYVINYQGRYRAARAAKNNTADKENNEFLSTPKLSTLHSGGTLIGQDDDC